jgi:hypothetical protein
VITRHGLDGQAERPEANLLELLSCNKAFRTLRLKDAVSLIHFPSEQACSNSVLTRLQSWCYTSLQHHCITAPSNKPTHKEAGMDHQAAPQPRGAGNDYRLE